MIKVVDKIPARHSDGRWGEAMLAVVEFRESNAAMCEFVWTTYKNAINAYHALYSVVQRTNELSAIKLRVLRRNGKLYLIKV